MLDARRGKLVIPRTFREQVAEDERRKAAATWTPVHTELFEFHEKLLEPKLALALTTGGVARPMPTLSPPKPLLSVNVYLIFFRHCI